MYNDNVVFDFEENIKKTKPEEKLRIKRDPKHGTVVCSHWLVGLCQSQESGDCGFLHRLDRSKMPKCKYGKACKIKNCLLAHIEEEEKPECPFFKQGFCMRGPHCKNRHTKLGPEDLPEVANFDAMAGVAAGAAGAAGAGGQAFKRPRKTLTNDDGTTIDLYKVSLCRYFQEHGTCPFKDNCNYAHGEAELREVRGRTRDHAYANSGGPGSAAAPVAPAPDYYTGEATGFMFTCEPPMVPEIFQKRIMGLPVHMREAAQRGIARNAPLFVYDTVNKNIFGLYSATSPVSDNLDSQLFASCAPQPCPVQVRFSIILDAAPVSTLVPEMIMMFGPTKPPQAGPLTMQQTKFLANVFATRCGVMPSATAGAGGRPGADGHGKGGGASDGYRPPFKYTDIVQVGIPFTYSNLGILKRCLIGHNNDKIFGLVAELGGQRSIRLRLRGIGSGFKEGAMGQELREPLHFNVSAESEVLLAQALERMRGHIAQARAEMQAQTGHGGHGHGQHPR